MKRFFLFILSAIFFLFSENYAFAAKNKEGSFEKPNFNYPQTVIKNANTHLLKALENGNGEETIMALIQSSLAKSMISTDSLPEILFNINKVASQERNPNIKAILLTLEATILNNYYNQNRYKLSQRESGYTQEININEIFEWNEQQFKHTISTKLDSALNYKNTLFKESITTYPKIIIINDISINTYPSLYDFIAYQAIEIYETWNIRNLWNPFIKNESAVGNDYTQKVLNIYNDLLNLYNKGSKPYIEAMLNKMEFTGDNKPQQIYSLYQLYKNSPNAAPILLKLVQKDNDKKRNYNLLKSFLKEYPDNDYASLLIGYIYAFEKPKANLLFKKQYSSSDSITFTCEIENISHFNINIYQLKEHIRSISDYDFSKDKPIHSQTFELNKNIIFCDTLNITLPPLPYGCYVANISMADNQKGSFEQINSRLTPFIVSNITSFITLNKNNKSQRIFAINSTTGNPYQGVLISSTSIDKNPQKFSKTTNNSGFVTINSDSFCNFNFKKGNDKYYSADFFSRYNSSIDENKYLYHAQIFTDLAIYRPGDTMHMSAIAYRTKPDKKELLIDKKMEISLVDTNNETITTVQLTTDYHGRIAHDFTIPENRLNGEFSIYIKDCTTNQTIGRTNITVSDYKSPTFYIEFCDIQNTYSKEDKEITLSGVAKTFSDMPIANVMVKCELSVTSFYGGSNNIASIDTYTDVNGNFSVTLDTKKLIDNSIGTYCSYKINATITDNAGETQYNNTYFNLGKSIILNWDYYNSNILNVNANKKSYLPITIQSNENNSESNIPCTLILKNIDDKTEKIFSFDSSKPTFDFSGLNSGKYKLTAWANEDTTAKIDNKDIIIYRKTDKVSPVSDALWTPQTRIECSPGEVFNILIGSTIENNNIYYTISYKETILKENWKRLPKGISTLSYSMPHDANADICVQLYCVKNQQLYQYDITIAPKHKKVITNLQIESFRNKITAGDTEKWTLHFTNNNKSVANGAIIASLTDKAINQLRDNKWYFNPIVEPYFTIHAMHDPYTYNWRTITNTFLWEIKNINRNQNFNPTSIISVPQFNFFNQSFFSSRTRYRTRSNVMLSKGYAITEDSMVETAFGEANVFTSINQMAIADNERSTTINNNIIRTSQIKTALWKPSLVTDKEGNAHIEFIVPNYNTTWLLQAVGYDNDINSATILKEIISNKPIMVKANMPRFIRQGDTATLMASIQNATDSTQHCNAYIELFNPITNAIYVTKKYYFELNAKDSQIASIEYSIPDSISLLAFRVKANNGTHGDGEQVTIPVLTSTTPIIESQPFYIPLNESYFEIKLPIYPQNTNITFEYCDNPMWYIACALPSINSEDNTTSTQIAHSIFAHLVTTKVTQKYPQILKALKYWKENPNDSALISLLDKNDELKIGNLLASPFMQASKEQSLRMAQLYELFDSSKVENTTHQLINKLNELQLSDGGFSWYKHQGNTSSLYTTVAIMQIIGKAKSLGANISNELNDIINNAIRYLDKTIVEQYNKQQDKLSYLGYLNFAYTRSLFLEVPMSVTVSDLYNHIIQSISSEWQDMNIADKAFSAITLVNFNKKEQAKPIIASIGQFSIYKQGMGRFWDNYNNIWSIYSDKVALTSLILQAYQKVSPNSVYIDQIKEWLLLEKQTNDWGNSSMAADAVYAFLSTETDPLEISTIPDILINGSHLYFNNFDKILGYGKINLDIAHNKKNTISINRHTDVPAWGAVYYKFIAPIKSIKAASVSALSIKKEIINLSSENDSLKIGDKVMIKFVVKNSRNLEYVTLSDERPACIEPIIQMSEYSMQDNIGYYMEITDTKTNIFFNHLPKGTHVFSYETYVTNSGDFSTGIATIQCQYAPQIIAHSAGYTISVE